MITIIFFLFLQKLGGGVLFVQAKQATTTVHCRYLMLSINLFLLLFSLRLSALYYNWMDVCLSTTQTKNMYPLGLSFSSFCSFPLW